MTARGIGVLLAAGIVTFGGAAFGIASAEQSPAKGAGLLLPFKQELKAALVEGMQKGPENAIDVCRLQAPALAALHSTDGVTVGRSSHRLRNPGNAGPGWVQEVVASYIDGDGMPEPVTLALDDGREGYVEPILTGPLCLACHGTQIDASVAGKLEQRYPEDRATGFEAGDLRGVFWIAYPRDDEKRSQDSS